MVVHSNQTLRKKNGYLENTKRTQKLILKNGELIIRDLNTMNHGTNPIILLQFFSHHMIDITKKKQRRRKRRFRKRENLIEPKGNRTTK